MKVAVLGVGLTKFGELWDKSLTDLLAESQRAALRDADLKPTDIDTIFTGNMCAKSFANQGNLGALAAQVLNINVPSTVLGGECASGGLALRAAISAIESGFAKVVLVNGVEKMTDVSSVQATTGLMAAASAEWELFHGATFPSLIAMVARLYMDRYGLTREELAAVSVQNHENGALNPYAHLQRAITKEHVLNSPMVADPLTLFDCSPVSDGAASVIVAREDVAKKLGKDCVFVVGSGQATDKLVLTERDDLLTWKANQLAAQAAYEMAGIGPQDIDIAELHDGFSIVQILSFEDLGFCKKGEGGKKIARGQTSLRSDQPINTSGGLKSRGHPVGATGVAQIVEVVNQLRGRCGQRQVDGARIGLTHNVGGAGSSVVVHIFQRGGTSRRGK